MGSNLYLTNLLRKSFNWIVKPKQQAKSFAKKSLQVAKKIYQSRSKNSLKIEKHRKFLAKYAPQILTFTETRLNERDRLALDSKSIEAAMANIPETPRAKIYFNNSNTTFENAENIAIKTSDIPFVTVIIPIYGKVSYTLNCLASIAENIPQVPFEVIIIDDCSPDESFKILEKVKGIRLEQNEQNQGFIRSCNRGAELAKGNFLYFLNNDTQVTPGWMDELIRTFHEFPETGFVGSKLIYPDAQLQEAGGIIWQDGSAWNFGRYQDPRMPVFNYAREVDYCSGASIMIPKHLFQECGGFDELYLPAYCEDADLALKIRDKGYRVIYQPLSTVIHCEGISSGTDLTQGVKSYQVKNTEKLFTRWKKQLTSHKPNGIDVDSEKDRMAKRRVLVLDLCTPTPNQDAGSLIVFNILLLLREMGFQVTFIPEDNFLYMPEYTAALQRVGIEVLYAPYVTSVEEHLIEYGKRYDLAFIFRPAAMQRNIELIRKYSPQAEVVYHTQDLHYLRMTREAELFRSREKAKEADEMKFQELACINQADASIVVSEKELEILQTEVHEKKVYVFPLILDTPEVKNDFAERDGIVFVGGFQHPPNKDAVNFFISEILPLIQVQLPEVKFYIVGSNVPAEIENLASPDVIVTGFIENLNQFLDKRRVSIAPLRFGAGIKGKIGSAMAVGLPVVATSLATEGMQLIDGKHILTGDTPKDFAELVIKIYSDETLWNKISQNSFKFAENAWGVEAAWRKLESIINELGIRDIQKKHPVYVYSENKYNHEHFTTDNRVRSQFDKL